MLRMWSAFIFLFAVCPVDAAAHLHGFKFKCPYASLWLEHGAERATQLLSSEPAAPTSSGSVPRCALPPGLPSGAHQHALSPGYSPNCSGTPAQGSPYMYPMAWKANTKVVALKAGANTPFAAQSTVGVDWFRLDLNWIRTDTFLPGGNQAVSLFRGSRLTILSLSGGNITSCVWVNMSLVGPNRPDWFLDDVGGGPIDNQYIGTKFIEYQGEPRLVREWRKIGISNEVFTLQMDEYLTDENNHTRYPLTANIPGEKKAYDHFKTWTNHEALELDDTAPFLLDQTLPPGACILVPASRPNVTNTTKASAMNVDPEAFKHVVWTGSPYSPPPSPPTPTPPPPPGPKKGSYQCTVCEHVYDPVKDGGGLTFEQLPDSWTCPICGAPKSDYKQVDGVWQH